MEKENVIEQKAFDFAIRVVKLYQFLNEKSPRFPIATQILRSGTSVGANVNESLSAESKKDFVHKLGIAAKEARETMYWLKLLAKTGYLDEVAFASMSKDCKELLTILNSIILTSQRGRRNENDPIQNS
jgi:four helix bundle protein